MPFLTPTPADISLFAVDKLFAAFFAHPDLFCKKNRLGFEDGTKSILDLSDLGNRPATW